MLAGFVSFADHPLEGVRDSIAALRRDGVEVKILTGEPGRGRVMRELRASAR